MQFAIVVPWVSNEELSAFLKNWEVSNPPGWLVLQQDSMQEGCGPTKNKGVDVAVGLGAEMVVVLDGDCYPSDEARTLEELAEKHMEALTPQPVELFEKVTEPPSRGTPYLETTALYPVAASMGFWVDLGDYCAIRQLAFGGSLMQFSRKTMFERYFPLCGMNLAFRPREWLPWCRFIDVLRFDDIWMGWLWQREAYRRGYCFNLAGPLIRHSRQSNVWDNLRDEIAYLEENETLWRKIALHEYCKYEDLVALLPR